MDQYIEHQSQWILKQQKTGWNFIDEIESLLEEYDDNRDTAFVPPYEKIKPIIEGLAYWIDRHACPEFSSDDMLLEIAEYIVAMHMTHFGHCCEDAEAFIEYAYQKEAEWFQEAENYIMENGREYAESILQEIFEEEGIEESPEDHPDMVTDIHYRAVNLIQSEMDRYMTEIEAPCTDAIFENVFELLGRSDLAIIDRDEFLCDIREKINEEKEEMAYA